MKLKPAVLAESTSETTALATIATAAALSVYAAPAVPVKVGASLSAVIVTVVTAVLDGRTGGALVSQMVVPMLREVLVPPAVGSFEVEPNLAPCISVSYSDWVMSLVSVSVAVVPLTATV